MTRTQILLDDATYEAARRRAFGERKSLSALVREVLGRSLGTAPQPRRRKTLFPFAGIVKGTGEAVSERHDEFLGRGKRW